MKLPLISYCGIEFNHSKWRDHLKICQICNNTYQELKLEYLNYYKNKVCECGCGSKVNIGHKFIRRHESRTPEFKLKKSLLWKENNPSFNVKNRKYGDDNPSKRIDVRKKISDNNPMKNPDHKKKCLENRQKAGYEKTILLNKTLWNDKALLEKRVNTYCTNLSNGKINLKNNWKTGYYTKRDGTQEWFDSSFEEIRMKYYVDNNIEWTKKHGIKIPYVNINGLNTFYVPDFLIKIDNIKIIDEVKGWIKEGDILKAQCCIEFCEKNNYYYRFFLGENFKKINELSYDITDIIKKGRK